MNKVIECDRCGRRTRNHAGWNAIFEQGRIVGHLCPNCQTPEENAEAAVNEATLAYSRGDDGVFRAESIPDREAYEAWMEERVTEFIASKPDCMSEGCGKPAVGTLASEGVDEDGEQLVALLGFCVEHAPDEIRDEIRERLEGGEA